MFVLYIKTLNFSLQMHHPIQMKPADSENRNGEHIPLILCINKCISLARPSIYFILTFI